MMTTSVQHLMWKMNRNTLLSTKLKEVQTELTTWFSMDVEICRQKAKHGMSLNL